MTKKELNAEVERLRKENRQLRKMLRRRDEFFAEISEKYETAVAELKEYHRKDEIRAFLYRQKSVFTK